ncbi:MAG: lysylphosphatidylglycerol synthase transmembrane domain-containing protein [Rhodothermales bacterium]
MAKSAKDVAIQVGSFTVAGLLMWLALRGVDFNAVVTSLAQANYWWLLPIVIVTLLSHWLRAVRWSLFLDATTASNAATPANDVAAPVSRTNAFASVMVGYMANYAGPRLGEIIRTANVARQEKRPFSTVLGTVVIERLLDMVTFGLLLLTLPLVFADQIGDLWTLLTAPTQSWIEASSGVVLIGLLVALVIGGGAGIWFLIRGINNPSSRLGALAEHFREGMLSLLRTGKPVQITAYTIGMWICYGFMAWLPFILLGQHLTFDIGLIAAWGLMLIGAFGVIIPSPGGIGTYHFITIQSLALLFSMPQADAAAYALLTHTGQMIIYIAAGFFGLLFMGNKLTATTPPNES